MKNQELTPRQLTRLARDEQTTRILLELIRHPIFSALVALIVVESLQKVKVGGQPLVGEITGTLFEGAATMTPVMLAMAKAGVFNDMVKASSDVTGKLGSLLPLLATVA